MVLRRTDLERLVLNVDFRPRSGSLYSPSTLQVPSPLIVQTPSSRPHPPFTLGVMLSPSWFLETHRGRV